MRASPEMNKTGYEARTELQCFLIADIRGYTRFTQERGDEAAAVLVAKFTELARGVVSERNGRVVGVWGDQILAVFESARQGVRAAVQLQLLIMRKQDPEYPLRVGVGVDVGEAVLTDEGYRGAALNLAARLCSLAGPGEVLASEGMVHLARKIEGLAYSERGLVSLKGFADQVRVVEVVSELPAVEGGNSDATIRIVRKTEMRLPIGNFLGALPANPLVGRDAEVNRIFSMIDAVESGTGQFLIVAGERGVGKTRLAQEITLKVRNRGFAVATGRCYEPQHSVLYYPFLEVIATAYGMAAPALKADVPRRWPQLKRLLPDVSLESAAMDSPEDQLRLFRACAAFLVALAERNPVAVFIDDLQCADDASIALLQYLARHTKAQGVLLVATCDEAALARNQAVAQLLRDLGRERLVEKLSVPRLSGEGTAEMLTAIIGDMQTTEEFAQFVHRRTRGTPAFIEEMVRALGGHYQLVREVGAGGMGRVFQAVDTRSGKTVAIKIMFSSAEVQLEALLRFQQEGTVLSTLKHPNIVEVYGAFTEEHASCIIMELLEGNSLAELMQAEPLNLTRIKGLTVQVADALAFAHDHAIVHRDIKPDNIMVVDDDRVKVTDFGIARVLRTEHGGGSLTGTGKALGTPLYMSPEQVQGLKVDGRADVYALGAVLYHMVTGRPPFLGEDAFVVAFKHVREAPQPPRQINPDIPADWEDLILRALAKDPAHRFQTASGMRDAIAGLTAHGEPVGEPFSQTNMISGTPPSLPISNRDPGASTLWEQGRMKERERDYTGALADYRAALALASPGELRNDLADSTARVVREIGRQKELAGDADAALEEYRMAMALASSTALREALTESVARLTAPKSAKPKRNSQARPAQDDDRQSKGGHRAGALIGVAVVAAAALLSYVLYPRLSGSGIAAQATATAQSSARSEAAALAEKTAVARAQLAVVTETLKKSGQVFGPVSASLSNVNLHLWSHQGLRDFIARARFDNPSGLSGSTWEYGFWFRNFAAGGQYRLLLNSDKQYRLILHDMAGDNMTLATAAHGHIPTMDVSRGGHNDVTLLVEGGTATLAVNGQATAVLNVSRKLTPGDIAVSAGSPWDLVNNPAHTPFRVEDFTVWSLKRGTSTSASGSVTSSGPHYAGVGLRDFIAIARFQNPGRRSAHVWDYGFWFRNTENTGQYRLTVGSDGKYALLLHNMAGDHMGISQLAHGKVSNLNLTPGASNTLTVFVDGSSALFSVNGQPVKRLDVSAALVHGDVGVATGPRWDQAQPASSLHYDSFVVWPVVDLFSAPSAASTSSPLQSAVASNAAAALRGDPIDGIPCQPHLRAYATQVHLAVLVAGSPLNIPAGIGINEDHGCVYWLHVPQAGGFIHVTWPYPDAPSLGTFFDIWGVALNRSQVQNARVKPGQTMKVYVNGRLYHGDPRTVPLKAHALIDLQIGPPFQPPRVYTFPPPPTPTKKR